MAEPGQVRAGRAPWESISREGIVQAAVRMVSTEAYEKMSIRVLAGSLGVAPMSLYRHVRGKDDLLDEVVSPAAVDRMNAMMSVLQRTGVGEETARSAYGAVHTYTIGFAALEASRARRVPGSAGPAALPATYTTTGQFTEGLRYLLEGISGHAAPGGQ